MEEMRRDTYGQSNQTFQRTSVRALKSSFEVGAGASYQSFVAILVLASIAILLLGCKDTCLKTAGIINAHVHAGTAGILFGYLGEDSRWEPTSELRNWRGTGGRREGQKASGDW